MNVKTTRTMSPVNFEKVASATNGNNTQSNGNSASNGQKIATVIKSSKENTSTSNTETKQPPPMPRSLKLKGSVGFEKLAAQYVAKFVKDGFAFNILCIGETGIGKSTLMDTLFNTSFNLEPSSHHGARVTLNSSTHELCEDGVRLKLTIVETAGFGDQINKENSHEPIASYIQAQFEAGVQEELSFRRHFRQINDTRIHVCLYFISPTGHSLKTIDLSTMKALDRKVNIIPIIAKADTINKSELSEFKKRIMLDLGNNNVSIYKFPINDYDLDISNLNENANQLFPLAVVGSTDLVKIGTKLTRGRHYEWGTVAVENESHCDFAKLRQMLLGTNMFDLIETTHHKHYQLYRANRLREMGFCDEDEADSALYANPKGSSAKAVAPRSILNVFTIKTAELKEEMEQKEAQMKDEFVKKVKEKECQLRDAESELHDRFAAWKKEQIENKERLDEKKRMLENEIREFAERKFTFEKSKFSTLNSANSGKSKKR